LSKPASGRRLAFFDAVVAGRRRMYDVFWVNIRIFAAGFIKGLTMTSVKVKIINSSRNPLPSYATPLSAGMDLRAFLESPVTLHPLERVLIPTGIRIELPQGYECQLRPRSGLALKKGLTLLNSPGTIDADYRGEIGVIVINLSNEPVVVNDGERICQMVVAPYSTVEWDEAETLTNTERGSGGFGHTGTN